ncbi:hypothetical protein FGB62_4g242 [Gracilaria domingensis]|nr:hypothetical protein FGB62_4g242 [Gracilaria domingensis]
MPTQRHATERRAARPDHDARIYDVQAPPNVRQLLVRRRQRDKSGHQPRAGGMARWERKLIDGMQRKRRNGAVVVRALSTKQRLEDSNERKIDDGDGQQVDQKRGVRRRH